jgi:hypothetical protein
MEMCLPLLDVFVELAAFKGGGGGGGGGEPGLRSVARKTEI